MMDQLFPDLVSLLHDLMKATEWRLVDTEQYLKCLVGFWPMRASCVPRWLGNLGPEGEVKPLSESLLKDPSRFRDVCLQKQTSDKVLQMNSIVLLILMIKIKITREYLAHY